MAKSLSTFATKYYADSVEWCPGRNLVACGNYQLEEKKAEDVDQLSASRQGCIYLIESMDDDSLVIRDQIETRGILDQKWFSPNRLGAVTSIGELIIYELDLGEIKLKEQVKTTLDDSKETIALSLDYSAENVLVSDSKGQLTLFNYTESQLTNVETFSGHEFEAWTCSFDKNDPNILYSGGDDSLCNLYDTRCGFSPRMKNKQHSAGVTSMTTIEGRDCELITGSYDERLRLFDTRSFRQPLCELNLHGGIWRIKPNPVDPELILCACMYENFAIVRRGDGFSCESTFLEPHEAKNICYGADWGPQDTKTAASCFKFATCSFYDKLFSLNSYQRD